MKINHWKTQLDTTKDTLIRINIQKTKQAKNIRGGDKGTSPRTGIKGNKRYHKENLERMYRKKGRGWTKHIDFMLIDIACIVIAFFISYVIRFGFNNPYVDKDYRILGVAFLLIDFFVEIMADSFKNVLKRGYLDEFISTCKHAVLVFLATALFLFTTQMADIYSRLSFYIMFPIYVTITYVARLALKSFLKKKGFGASKKSLFVIAPDAMLRDTLRTVEKSCIGYTKIVAASLDTDMKGKTICGIPIVANHDGIVDYACDEWVDEVLIPPCSEDEYPEKMADIFLEMGIAVHTGIAKNGTAQGGYKQIEKIGDYYEYAALYRLYHI